MYKLPFKVVTIVLQNGIEVTISLKKSTYTLLKRQIIPLEAMKTGGKERKNS